MISKRSFCRAAFALVLLVSIWFSATPIHAGVLPAKSELGVSGTFVKPKGDSAIYAFDGQVAMPVDTKGYFLAGPKLHFDSDDAKTAAGAVLEVNFGGTAKSGLYAGVNGLYNLKDVAGTERYTVAADFGAKIAIGAGGSGFKVFADKPVAGRGKDDSVITYNAGLLVRF